MSAESMVHYLARGVVLQARDEIDALMSRLGEPCAVDVSPIHDHGGSSLESEPAGYLDIAGLAVGNHDERRNFLLVPRPAATAWHFPNSWCKIVWKSCHGRCSLA